MNGYFTQNWVEFFQLQTLGCVLFVLGGNVARHTWHAAFFVLSALQDYLNSVTFFCHFLYQLLN